ncbi:MAG: phosphate propanoyltransferase [Lachnospiraceae bacterium]|nr:phosphate propanoyltransferase [Lachnospiraceae bacterium]
MAFDEKTVRRIVLTELAGEGTRYVPVAISARHVHLSLQDLETLFGAGYQLTPLKPLVQPGQFASREQVTLAGPKGKLEKVRIIGPVRKATQVEVSMTDSIGLGIKNCPIRMSGDIEGTPGIRVIGPKGEITLDHGVIVAKRHLHLSEEEARAYGIHNGQVISLRVTGPRSCILNDVVCRTGKGHELEFHVDTDEANGCCLKNEELLEVLISGEAQLETCKGTCKSGKGCTCKKQEAGKPEKAKEADKTGPETGKAMTPEAGAQVLDLVTERDVNDACGQRRKKIFCGLRALITPSASDRAGELGIEIVRTECSSARSAQPKPEPGEKILELITERDINDAYRDNREIVYGTSQALITQAARERAAATGIQMIRI